MVGAGKQQAGLIEERYAGMIACAAIGACLAAATTPGFPACPAWPPPRLAAQPGPHPPVRYSASVTGGSASGSSGPCWITIWLALITMVPVFSTSLAMATMEELLALAAARGHMRASRCQRGVRRGERTAVGLP